MSLLKVNEVTDLAGVIPDGVGRIVQIVRGTDATNRTTTSTSMADANISVTITPTMATSNVMLIWAFHGATDESSTQSRMGFQIVDSSNTSINGAQDHIFGIAATGATYVQNRAAQTIIGWDSPASTSALTYKGRFRVLNSGDTGRLYNGEATGQLFAIEVAG